MHTHQRLCRFLLVIYLLLPVFFFSAAAEAEDGSVYHVLLLNSYHQGYGTDNYAVIKSVLTDSGLSVELYSEYFDSKRFTSEAQAQLFREMLARKYGNLHLDIIISTDDNALSFLVQHKDDVFGKIPVVFGGINNIAIADDLDRDSYTGFFETVRIEETIDLALKLHPNVKKIVVIHDDTDTSNSMHDEVMQIKDQYPEIGFEHISGHDNSSESMIQSTSSLPGNSVALLMLWNRGLDGRYYSQQESAAMISKVSPVPVYCITLPPIGHGVVGGKVQRYETHIEAVAGYAIRVLQGESTRDLPLVSDPFSEYVFDYNQLHHWNIRLSNLPDSSTILNRPQNFYSLNKELVWFFAVILALSIATIVVLTLYFSGRVAMERKIREGEKRYRLLFETSRDPLNINTPDGKVIDVNQAFLDLFGYKREDIVDFHMTDIYFEPSDRPAILARLLKEGYIKNYPVKLKNKDGTLIDALFTANLMKDENGNPDQIFVNTHDVGERKRLETQLMQAHKMESVGRLAGGIAHDFNNILTAIIGYTEFALSSVEMKDELYEDLVEIKKNADRAAELTKKLLAFSRRQMAAPRVMNLNEALTDMEKMLKRLIGENIQFNTVFVEDIWKVFIDPGQIEQVLVNLVVNARDAIGEKGTITVETANTRFGEHVSHNHFDVVPGEYVMLAVSDDGVGIDEITKNKIFDPFFTTKEQGKGTGLGLATCYGIVKQNRGYIWVYSEPGMGTTFKVYFPCDSGISTEEQGQEQETPVEVIGGVETVLVAEDEESVRKMIVRALEESGYTVHCAHDGVMALELMEKEGLKPDILVTDAVMPRMGGFELHEKASGILPSLKTLYITGYTNTVFNTRGDGPQANLIQKPFTQDNFLSTIRSILDS